MILMLLSRKYLGEMYFIHILLVSIMLMRNPVLCLILLLFTVLYCSFLYFMPNNKYGNKDYGDLKILSVFNSTLRVFWNTCITRSISTNKVQHHLHRSVSYPKIVSQHAKFHIKLKNTCCLLVKMLD